MGKQATPRFITDGEYESREAGDVKGPTSAVDGHLAVFDGATGKKIKDGGAVPGGGSSNVSVIDLGVKNATDIWDAGGMLELIPYASGQQIDKIFFTPDGFVASDTGWPFHIMTPNRSIVAQGDLCCAFWGSTNSNIHDHKIFDTDGVLLAGSGASVLGELGSEMSFRDCGPLVIVSHQQANWFGSFLTWTANTAFTLNETIITPAGTYFALNGGVTGESEPTWGDPTVVDGTITCNFDVAPPTQGALHVHAMVLTEPDTLINRPASIEFIQQPTDTQSGQAISPSPTVRVLDQNGDPYVMFSIQIEVATLGGNGSFSSNASNTDQSTGIATFSGMTITADPETYRLRARADFTCNIPPVDSDPFDVTAP